MKFVLPVLLLLSGCMVGPKYHPPEMAMPPAFEEGNQVEGADADLAQWWEQFDDPVLDGFIQEALDANYDLLIALEKIEQTRAQYRIERSHLWPEIDLTAAAIRTRISQNLLPPPTVPGAPTPAVGASVLPTFLNMFQVGFDALWELDFFGKFRHGKKAARYIWEATKEDFQTVMISMLSEVAVNYMGIRALQQKIELAKSRIAADEEELAMAGSLFQIGLDNEIQVKNLIAALETDRSALFVLNTSFKQSVYALAVLLGRQPEGLLEVFAEVGPVPSGSGKVPIGLPSDLLRRRPDVRSAERQLAAATEQIGAAIADFFPHFFLTGVNLGGSNQLGSSIGYENNKLHRLFSEASRSFSVGIGINWDLLDFGRVRGRVDVQNSLQRQALLTYEQTVITSLKDVESALVAYFEQQDRKLSLGQKVEALERTLEIMEGLHRVGLVSWSQVLDARKVLIDSQSQLVESEQSLAGDLVAIYKAIGGNWVVPLTEPAEEGSGNRERADRDEGHGPYIGEHHIGG